MACCKTGSSSSATKKHTNSKSCGIGFKDGTRAATRCGEDSSAVCTSGETGGCCKGGSETFPGTGLKIFYSTTKGTARGFAKILAEQASSRGVPTEVRDLEDYDPEDLQEESDVCIFFLPTYEGGTPTPSAKWFYTWLDDARNDFRIDKRLLRNFRYAVFGLGSSEYRENFNVVGTNVDNWLAELDGTRVLSPGVGDENVINSKEGGQGADFEQWL